MKSFSLVKLFSILFFLSNFLNSETIKFGLGSCLDQDYPQPIWTVIEAEQLNHFVFLGDNVYGDLPTGSLSKMRHAYKKQSSILPEFLNQMEIFPIWDDHDYGINDGGGDYKLKKDAKKMFLDFWEIPENDIRHEREGIYFSDEKIFFDKKFKLIFLDTRYFRSKLIKANDAYIKNEDIEATILGKEQWDWLSSELKDDFDFLIVFSSIQILAKDHRFEKWSNFPKERNKLLNYLHEFRGKTLLVSGDRHRGGIYKKNNLYEITASSLNKPGSYDFETDKYLFGKTFPEENYGTIEISKSTIKVNLKGISGQLLNSITIKY
tara:strand:+ start:1634 stop:2596 length:963 start_codon:yes stop_codon:yes gene_type:complete